MILTDMATATHVPSALAAHRGLQRLAHGVLERVDAGLRDGMTERDVAMRIEGHLAERGVFELRPGPFVWFGDRSAGNGLGRWRRWAPSLRALATGMPVILGVAFRFHDFPCQVAHATSFGDNPALAQARADLARVRDCALAAARAEATIEAIERAVNDAVAALGYEAIDAGLPGLGRVETVAHELWRVAPHIARDGVGAAFSELLLVAPGCVQWLDDDHHTPVKENDREA